MKMFFVRKMFFSEEKNQKTFNFGARGDIDEMASYMGGG